MIELVDRGEKSLIRFTPRYKFRHLPTIECDLIYGHQCPICRNVIQALYYVDQTFDLANYEETKVLSQGEKNAGELLKIVPNEEDQGNYRVQDYRFSDSRSQLIVLKNHVVNWKGLSGNRDEFFEVGERCCSYTAVISLQEKNVVRDLAAVAGYSLAAYGRYNEDVSEPTIEFLANWLKTAFSWETLEIKMVNAIGSSPPALMVKRSVLKSQFPNTVSNIYKAWDVKVAKERENSPLAA